MKFLILLALMIFIPQLAYGQQSIATGHIVCVLYNQDLLRHISLFQNLSAGKKMIECAIQVSYYFPIIKNAS